MHTFRFRDAIDVNYQRMELTGEEVPPEGLRSAAPSLVKALRLRSEYMDLIGAKFPTTTRNFLTGKYPRELPKCRRKNTESSANMGYNPPEPPKDHWGLDQPLPKYEQKFKLRRQHGTVAVLDSQTEKIVATLQKYYVPREKYLKDFNWIDRTCNEGPLKTFCYQRLTFLQTHFQLHVQLNEQLESAEQRSVPHRDFYNIRKVDTHIHAASSMNHKHLLRFIKKKMRADTNEIVHIEDGKKVTMHEIFKQMGISSYDLTVDMLDVHADRDTFHRFDRFNAKYNPIGQNVLREIFIKTDNHVDGRYFAELLKEVLSDVEENKYENMEPRLSIYGRTKDEWDKLARWAINHDVWSRNVRWMIQVPRLYNVYRCKNLLPNFDTFLENLFTPLFEVTNDPSSHPDLHRFLQHVSGLDSVDDETKQEHVPFTKDCPEPAEYTGEENPSYSYYLFYMFSNLTALNAFRRMRGLNTFALRPHCGEAVHVNHLSVAYLTSESIAHGLLLRKAPVLQYLFYLAQTGIAMSPVSNNHLFLTYERNPMPEFLKKGLNVSLSTDDPLQFHITKEALMEEYSIAAQLWKLSTCDLCELARNSVLQSGFEDSVKLYWLGPNYREEGVLGNDVSRTNVPDIRVSYRYESFVNELCNLFKAQKELLYPESQSLQEDGSIAHFLDRVDAKMSLVDLSKNYWNNRDYQNPSMDVRTVSSCIAGYDAMRTMFGYFTSTLAVPNNSHNFKICYAEFQILAMPEKEFIFIGLAPSNFPVREILGSLPNTYSINKNGTFRCAGDVKAGFVPNGFAQGDTIGCGLVMTNCSAAQCDPCRLFFTKNGRILGTPLAISPTCSELFPTISFHGAGSKVIANFGNEPFKYAIPPAKGRCWRLLLLL